MSFEVVVLFSVLIQGTAIGVFSKRLKWMRRVEKAGFIFEISGLYVFVRLMDG